jgi:putative hemolysin
MELLILVLLILLNGVFRAVRDGDRLLPSSHAAQGHGRQAAMSARETALRLLDDPSKLLSTVQIGITAIGVIAGAYGATARCRMT